MELAIDNSLSYIFCPLCKSRDIFKVGNIVYKKPLFFSSCKIDIERVPELWRCKSCKSCFTQNIIKESIAYDLYMASSSQKRWASDKEIFDQSKSKNILKILSDEFDEGRMVLDFGCNTGLLLDFAKSKGCITIGVELSNSSINILKEKQHIVFESLEIVKDYSLDIITAFDVVEHMYDLPAFLQQVSKKLKTGGKLIILTGNINSISAKIARNNWWYTQYPEHIIFPSLQYFKYHTDLEVDYSISTYASIGYEPTFTSLPKVFIKYIFSRNYNGLPTTFGDHYLLVCEKK